MSPAFHKKCLKDFITNFNNVSNRFLIRMGNAVNGEKMVEKFSKVTFEAIGQVSFNVNTNMIKDPESPFLYAIRQYLNGALANIKCCHLRIFRFELFKSASQRVQINPARFLRKVASLCFHTSHRY